MAKMTYQKALQVALRYGTFYREDNEDAMHGVPTEYYCQYCYLNKVFGHKPNCEIAQMLEKGKE